jgi:hypothetical protein
VSSLRMVPRILTAGGRELCFGAQYMRSPKLGMVLPDFRGSSFFLGPCPCLIEVWKLVELQAYTGIFVWSTRCMSDVG